jgi:Glycoside-hydrolase family GH114
MTIRMARVTLAAMVALAAGALAPAAVAAAAAPAAVAPAAVAAAAAPAVAAAAGIPGPVPRGTLRISGTFRDGATVAATGLRWQVPRLPDGVRLVSFEVAYQWQSCAAGGKDCRSAADSTATPYAARAYVVGHADTGRILRLTVTASEVVVSRGSLGDFPVIQRSVTRLATAAVRTFPRHQAPLTAFVNGTPERQTASTDEYFQVAAPHANAADGPVSQWYRIDAGGWRAMPASRVLYTGKLAAGPHRVAVRTANRAGATTIAFGWRVIPMPTPVACRSSSPGGCWYPTHLDKDHHPMRWDWQIGRVTPLQRTGRNAVDIYDIDGFLTTRAEVTAIKATWQAATLPHPRTACYLDLAWEDYRPDATPGRYFPAATLGLVYFGFPEERWLDFRQLGALKSMLRERIAMCARKGFDAVELDDIDSFDPPSTTGFHLTPGDVESFLAYAFNEVHRFGMTALWKNSPYLSWWGRHYTDGAVVEECYVSRACFAAQFQGSHQYGFTCTAVHGSTPCGWDDFTTDATARQPTGKWVGETEYTEDDYVCDPGRKCPTAREFATFCRAVYSPPYGFTAMKLDADLDGGTFFPCP